MATGFESVTAAIAAVNEATNALALRVQALLDQIATTEGEGLTGPQVVALEAQLTSLKTQLENIGKSATEPIPPPPPEPPALPGPFRTGGQPNQPGQPPRR